MCRFINSIHLFVCLASLADAFHILHNSNDVVVKPVSKCFAVTGELKTLLKKPSKTLSSIFEVDAPSLDSGDLDVRSMQLRKANVSAIYSNNLKVMTALAKEQSSAIGNFPGPCPIIYDGKGTLTDIFDAGASAVVVDVSDSLNTENFENIIYRITSVEDVMTVISKDDSANAFLITVRGHDNVDNIIESIPCGSIIIASIESMQVDNAELDLSKTLRSKGVTSILMEKAIVGDNEDLEYTTFIVGGLTKKKSSTFNMTGKAALYCLD